MDETLLDRDVTMCQYLMAEHLVRNILEWRCSIPSKDFREIAQAIFQRLKSLDGYTVAKDDDDRATQQLHLLADIVACWIAEILVKVAEDRKQALEEYCEKKRMKMMEVDEDEEMDSEIEDWKQVEQTKEKDDEWKIEDVARAAVKKEEEERKQLDEKEAEDKDAENERVENERKNEENMKEEREDEETHE